MYFFFFYQGIHIYLNQFFFAFFSRATRSTVRWTYCKSYSKKKEKKKRFLEISSVLKSKLLNLESNPNIDSSIKLPGSRVPVEEASASSAVPVLPGRQPASHPSKAVNPGSDPTDGR